MSTLANLSVSVRSSAQLVVVPTFSSGYVLENFQKALPSFAGLSKSQQDSIRFTHCHLEKISLLEANCWHFQVFCDGPDGPQKSQLLRQDGLQHGLVGHLDALDESRP